MALHKQMTSLERVTASINHIEPDRVPWDFWATPELEARLAQARYIASDQQR